MAVEDALGLTASARRALALVDVDPRQARRLAEETVARAGSCRDAAALSVAHRAAGLAALHLADLDTAEAHLATAVRAARRGSSRTALAEALMSLAFARVRRGEVRGALRCIEDALADAEGTARARVLVQRGAILQQLGRADAALRDYRAALPVLREATDWVWVQRVHSNRGHIYAYRSRFAQAEEELDRAEEICERQGLVMKRAIVHDNRGLLETRRGDVPAALRHLHEAERLHEALGAPVGPVLVDRSEVLLSVRLLDEARAAAERAVAEFTRLGRRINLPEAQLVVALAALLDGDPEAGRVAADQAASLFAAQQRRGWAALARHASLRCRSLLPDARPVPPAELVRAADELAREGWPEPALDARISAAEVLLRRGRLEEALGQLELARAARRSGPAQLRARSWYAEALARHAAGRPRGAARALTAGLGVLEEHQATLAATDIRTSVARHREDLVALGLRLALDTGRARSVLDWAERGRATALLMRPALPPDDPELGDALARLRAVVAELEDAEVGPVADGLRRRQVALERTVRDLVRAGARSPTARVPRVPVEELAAALGEDALVEYLVVGGQVIAVSLAAGRARLHRLAPLASLGEALEHVTFALRRLARPRSAAATAAAVTSLRAACQEVDAAVLAPLRRVVGDRDLVVVPTGPLQSLPFGLLPSAGGRGVTTAPSAALWRRAAGVEDRPGPVVAVAGPGLPAAEAEAREVAAAYDEAELLVGDEATTRSVWRALCRARTAHVAAHGHLRTDNPLFSSLRLADGPLTVYDLESLPSAPPLVVLAACDTARSRVTRGDELVGLAACFVALGTGTLIAPLVPVSDAAAAAAMLALHGQLRAGTAPARALARLQSERDDTGLWAAAAGLVCIGSGRVPQCTKAAFPPTSAT